MRILLTILLLPLFLAYIIVTAALMVPFMLAGLVYEVVFDDSGPLERVEAVVDRVWFVR